MPRRLIYLIVFIEGFSSLGAEIVALRRLLPHIGSAITVTAPTIALFLLALALGYAAGGRVRTAFLDVVRRNFLLAALLAGCGLSAVTVDILFASAPTAFAYLLLVGGILCPIAWLLGQTVPILTNLMHTELTGEASGQALFWSTLGSFLGALGLSLLVMQWLGVSAAVLLVAAVLLAALPVLAERRLRAALLAVAALLPVIGINLTATQVSDTAYAEYRVEPLSRPGDNDARAFWVNKSLASLTDASTPPRTTRYIAHLRSILLDELEFRGRDILVLGAGGFTLAQDEPRNRYTYVDIDPAIRSIAEEQFLRQPAAGEFIVDDGRRYVATTERRFDAVVVDVYSSHTAIPGHLVTREFWSATRRVLNADGVLLANLILDGKLESAYARNLLATVEAVYGRCAIDVLHKGKPIANVVLSCFASSQPSGARIYIDEKNRVDLDRSSH